MSTVLPLVKSVWIPFLKQHKQAEIFQKQKDFFAAQLELAQQFDKPVLLHIRKSHAEVLQILKQQQFKQGGIAHAFGGGIEEAKAFIKLGFKLGITGQITNPNAKKLASSGAVSRTGTSGTGN